MTAPATPDLTYEQAHHYMRFAYAVRNLGVATLELSAKPADIRRMAGVRRALTRLDEALTALEPPRQRRSPS